MSADTLHHPDQTHPSKRWCAKPTSVSCWWSFDCHMIFIAVVKLFLWSFTDHCWISKTSHPFIEYFLCLQFWKLFLNLSGYKASGQQLVTKAPQAGWIFSSLASGGLSPLRNTFPIPSLTYCLLQMKISPNYECKRGITRKLAINKRLLRSLKAPPPSFRLIHRPQKGQPHPFSRRKKRSEKSWERGCEDLLAAKLPPTPRTLGNTLWAPSSTLERGWCHPT